jgi:DNA-binding NarL/FixJ family response regulator
MLGTRDIDNTDADLLNERERAILELMGNGLTNEQIGKAVFLSKSSVKYHNKAIFRKLGVSNRAGAVKVATREGLIA